MILEYNATDGPEMNAKTWPLGHKTVPEASGRRRGRQSDSLGWTGAFIIQIGDERHGRGVWDGSKVVPRKNQKVQPGLACPGIMENVLASGSEGGTDYPAYG